MADTPAPLPGGESKSEGKSTPPKNGAAKMQQLLSLARERLREQQTEITARDATIAALRDELAAAAAAAATKREKETAEDEPPSQRKFQPRKAWCRVCESSFHDDARRRGAWVLFSSAGGGGGDDDDEEKWLRFADAAALEDFVRRDPGTEPLDVPEATLTRTDAARVKEEAEAAVARIADEFRKFRVSAEIERKRRDALDKEAAARRELVQEEKEVVDVSEETLLKLRDDCDSLRAENENLKSQLTKRRIPDEAPSLLTGEDAAAKWRQRYESSAKERERLASQIRSLTDADAGNEYAQLLRDHDTLQREFKLYRANALKAMRVQEQELKKANARATEERRALDKLGGRQAASLSKKGGDADAQAKVQYLKNLMAKYLATTEAKPKEHMERAILMVLGFSDDEKKDILAAASAAAAATSVVLPKGGGGFFG